MNFEAETSIDKPPREVYDFLLDKENLILWLTRFNQYITISGESDEKGSEAWYIFGFRNTKVKFHTRILELIVPTLIHTQLENKWVNILLKVEISEEAKHRSNVNFSAEYFPKTFLFRLYWLLNSRAIKKRHKRDLNNLKQVISIKNEVLGLV